MYIVTEGQMDAVLLGEVFRGEARTHGAKFVAAGDRWAITSFAKTLLVSKPEAVAVVVDSDSNKPERIEELRSDTEGALHMVAPPERTAVFIAEPSLESIFFVDTPALEKALGVTITEAQRARAEYDPKRVLDELLAKKKPATQGPARLAGLITMLDVDRLKQDSTLLRDIGEFIYEHSDRKIGTTGSKR